MSATTADVRAALIRWGATVHDQALAEMPDRIRPYAPIQTGELRRSIRRDRSRDIHTGERMRGRIVAPVIQARTTDQGAPPHVIVPRRAGGLLVFYWPKVGRTVYLRRVNHPGNRARPWWVRALNATYGPALRFAAVRTRLR